MALAQVQAEKHYIIGRLPILAGKDETRCIMESVAVMFGLLSALAWGGGDFCGGLASRHAPAYAVVWVSQAVGVMALAGLAWFTGEAWPSWADVAWGMAAGLAGVVGLLALYHALAQSRMGLAAPVSAVVSAALPVAVSLFSEGWPGWARFAGFGLALVAVWLIARDGPARLSWGALQLPLLAGVSFGLFLTLIGQVSATAVFWPLVAARFTSLSVVTGYILITRPPLTLPRAAWPAMLLAGVLDGAGNAFYGLAAQTGRLDVAAVLASLYPASTVLLAWRLLHERLARAQWAGVLLALLAIALIV